MGLVVVIWRGGRLGGTGAEAEAFFLLWKRLLENTVGRDEEGWRGTKARRRRE